MLRNSMFRFFNCCRRTKDILAAHEAIKNGDEETLNRLLKSGLNANSRIKKGDFTLLHRAVLSSNYKNLETMLSIIHLLLKFKADPNEIYFIGHHRLSPLHSAARRALPEVIKLLVDANANTDLLNDKGRTALDYATMNSNDRGEQVVSLLRLT